MGAHDTQAYCMQINNTMKRQKNKGMPSEKSPIATTVNTLYN